MGVMFCGESQTLKLIASIEFNSCFFSCTVVQFASGNDVSWYTNKKFLFTMYALCFLLPLCLPRRLKALSYTR